MILPCPLCQARFNVPDEKVTGPGTKIQCPKCKFTFVIKAPGASAAPIAEETPRTDTDPAIDPALAKAVVEEARAQDIQTNVPQAKAAPSDTIETKVPPSAAPGEAAASQPTVPLSAAVDPAEVAQVQGAEQKDDALPEGEDDSAPTEVDIDPELARKVLEEAKAEAPDAVAEIELDEVEPEAHALSPEELAKIPDAEIVDADDLAQLAETAGETEVKENLSPKVEAEAAGQWPSIIVDDPLLDGGGAESQGTAEGSPGPKSSQDAPSQVSEPSHPQKAGPDDSRQALETAQKRAQAAQKAVDQLMNEQDMAQAQQRLAAAQAELQHAMAQLQAAQQAYLAARQRLAARATQPDAQLGPRPAAQAGPVANPPMASQAAPGMAMHSHEDPLDDDMGLGRGTSQGRGLLLYGLVAALAIGAVVVFLMLRGSHNDKPRAKAVPAADDSKIWQGLAVKQNSIQVLPRQNSPSLVVVNVVLKNETSKYRYENPYISGVLVAGGSKVDEGVSPCGARLPSSVILSVVKAKGRQGYYDRLRKFVLASDETPKVPPGGSLPCQILFFDSTGHKSAGGLNVDLQVDRDKTIAAPVK